MNTFIIIGFGIGIAVVLFLLRVVFRKDETYDPVYFQKINSLMSNENVKVKVKEYISEQNKLGAIKYVHDNSGVRLTDAKKFVEDIEKNNSLNNNEYEKIGSLNTGTGVNEEMDNVVKLLLAKEKKIQAIKYVRERKNLSLLDAKNYVEKLEIKS